MTRSLETVKLIPRPSRLLKEVSLLDIYQGFILTRHARDTHNGPQIELWISSDQGPIQIIIEGERPVFFVLQEQVSLVSQIAQTQHLRIDIKPVALKSFSQQSLAAVL